MGSLGPREGQRLAQITEQIRFGANSMTRTPDPGPPSSTESEGGGKEGRHAATGA